MNAQVSGYEVKIEEARTKESELKLKIKKLKDESDSVTEKFESASSNASGMTIKSTYYFKYLLFIVSLDSNFDVTNFWVMER